MILWRRREPSIKVVQRLKEVSFSLKDYLLEV